MSILIHYPYISCGQRGSVTSSFFMSLDGAWCLVTSGFSHPRRGRGSHAEISQVAGRELQLIDGDGAGG